MENVSSGVNPSETQEKVPPAVYEIRRFVTNIWNNPLVDEKTRAFREESRAKFLQFFKDNNIPMDKFIAIPYGSLLWVTDDASDADYMLIQKSFNDSVDFRPYYSFLDTIKVAPHTAADVDSVINGPDYKTLLSLIITPDEYLIGNLALAAEIRKTGVNNALGQFNRNYAQARMETTFETSYKNWKDLDRMRWESAKSGSRARMVRYNKALAQRASQTHAPEKWKKAYEKALEDTWLPDLSVFAQCFNFTGGELKQLPPQLARANPSQEHVTRPSSRFRSFIKAIFH